MRGLRARRWTKEERRNGKQETPLGGLLRKTREVFRRTPRSNGAPTARNARASVSGATQVDSVGDNLRASESAMAVARASESALDRARASESMVNVMRVSESPMGVTWISEANASVARASESGLGTSRTSDFEDLLSDTLYHAQTGMLSSEPGPSRSQRATYNADMAQNNFRSSRPGESGETARFFSDVNFSPCWPVGSRYGANLTRT